MPTDDATLLRRHAPILRFDSAEAWLPAAVETFLTGAPDPGPRTYARAARGSDRRRWLTYWWYYAVNDYTLIGPWLHIGRHEGDWEMVQLRLKLDEVTPELLLAAQHARVGVRPWTRVERTGPGGTRPILYPARGCHASWFSPGYHWGGAWWDRADGRGPAVDPDLELLTDQPWIERQERWGATPPNRGWLGRLGLAAASPHGPGHQRQWRDPGVLLTELRRHGRQVLR